MKTNIFACVLVMTALCLLVSSCQNPAEWYPVGTATIVTHYETGGTDTAKSLVATVKLSNTGASTIRNSTATLVVVTDQKTYYRTFGTELRILPGASVYTTVSVLYADPAETLTPEGLTVGDAFFE